ncbi:lytic transglycosylase domain-containing protein [Roseateles oligotrophus]|uniref:Lytic transglycosylase domain-containing protein n=1 Tax=Roseateles oligotrophus TaxID=1769250 RepID=A0ABT2YAA9_9BURK|nr:lytic transglycosylase domain-containing protein [Roseateles oligotrophus]MCV2366990.1 lytic transglycosylase domain-containing protein [Roseateles oligotrophus]
MDEINFSELAAHCAPRVHPSTVRALVEVESGFNPHSIGVVGGVLVRQPRNLREARVTAAALQEQGWNFSVGLAQINLRNFERLGLTVASAFDACANLRAMQAVLSECFERAGRGANQTPSQQALRQALSCYYSGNFVTGFRQGYVQRVVTAASRRPPALAQPP